MSAPKKQFWSLRKALHPKKSKSGVAPAEIPRRASYSPVSLSSNEEDAPDDELNERYGEAPALVVETLRYMESRESYKVEGLFRVPGSVADIQETCKKYEDGTPVDLSKITTPHTVSGILKSYLRSHTSDLLTKKLYKLFLSVGSIEHEPSRVVLVAMALALLPQYNRNIVQKVLEFLQKMIQHIDVNKMPVANLALIFAPALMPPQEESIESAIFKGAEAAVVITTILKNHSDLFVSPAQTLTRKVPAALKTSLQMERFQLLYESSSGKKCNILFEESTPANEVKVVDSEDEEYELPVFVGKDDASVHDEERKTPIVKPGVVRTESSPDIRSDRFKGYRKARQSTNFAMKLYMNTLRKDTKRLHTIQEENVEEPEQGGSPSEKHTELYEQEIKNVLVWYLLDGNEDDFEKRVMELANDEHDREYIKNRTKTVVGSYAGSPRPTNLNFTSPASPKSRPKQQIEE